MAHEFIDEMFERLLVQEKKTFGETFEQVISERALTIRDLGRIENAYQLFCKRHGTANKAHFRWYIKATRPDDFAKCVNCFKWPDN